MKMDDLRKAVESFDKTFSERIETILEGIDYQLTPTITKNPNNSNLVIDAWVCTDSNLSNETKQSIVSTLGETFNCVGVTYEVTVSYHPRYGELY